MLPRLFASSCSFVCRRLCTISKVLNDGPQTGPITVHGWVIHRREYKARTFVVISDGVSSDTLQVVVENSQHQSLPKLNIGAAVGITGKLIPSTGRGQKYDFMPHSVDLIGDIDRENYPLGTIEKREDGYVRQYLHLRPKLMSFSAFLRLRNAAKHWLQNYLQARKFVCIDTPILTINDCEGAGESFYVEPADKAQLGEALKREGGPDKVETTSRRYFFSRPVYTTVSAQLHLEAAACAFRRIYAFNPAFRAESSVSRHHLAEFYMLEVEMAFINQLEPLLELVETMFKECSKTLISDNTSDYTACARFHNAEHMKIIDKTLALNKGFPRMTYKEALSVIDKGVAEQRCSKPARGTFTREQEIVLVEHCGNLPVFVLDYPVDSKPFYMARNKEDSDTAACFDLIAPMAGEIVGGSLRESEYEVLANRLIRLGLEHKLSWYLDLRRFGHPRTGGFGLGFERYLQWLLGMNNIKDCLPFPRWYNHCYL